MLSPLSDALYKNASIEAFEHPACELFPASRETGRLFGLGIGLGIFSLFLDGMGATGMGWFGLTASGMILLAAGSRVPRN